MKKVALYGLGSETHREIPKLDKQFKIVGLLDGFKTDGELYGKKIISMDQAITAGVERIIVIARPGSCKAIARRIGEQCKDHNVELYDIRGLNLLNQEKNVYGMGKLIDLAKNSEYKQSKSDNLKCNLFLDKIKKIGDKNENYKIDNAYDIGYLFCAPLITDFVLWLYEQIKNQSIENIWFSARDGFLIKKLFEILNPSFESIYFLTSRCAAIRAGMMNDDDINYVNSMKFSGQLSDHLKVRFGIDIDSMEDASGLIDYRKEIFKKSEESRNAYREYLSKLNIKQGEIAFYDFVAKGTTQYFVGKLIKNHMKGYYFLQLEPEFMKDKNLDITPFYSKGELYGSAIFDNYYILETILTSPEPSVLDFKADGSPLYAKETRTKKDIECFGKIQEGIIDYFSDYITRCQKESPTVNKLYDEVFLKMIHNVEIADEDFLKLIVEDPFFNRMTYIKDIL